ncbi:MAG: class I SAM-dependent methyltransferase [Nitrospinae bacterium]|nr:class I SAM-dependent methyltransferase [Nitrospinota bacterium]
MEIPTEAQFIEALSTYRKKWPNDGYFGTHQRFVETYSLLRSFYRGGKIVDVGGWPGDFSCALAELKFDVLLIDKDLRRPTAKVYDEATGKWVLSGTVPLTEKCRQYGIETLQCDLEHEPIPLEDSSVKFIVFTEVLEHLRVAPLKVLRELRRILKPEGRLLLTTPNLLSLRNRISFMTGQAKYDTLEMPFDALAAEERIGHAGHFRVFSMAELLHLLQHCGFLTINHTYKQITHAQNENFNFSFYSMRMKLWNKITKWIYPLGNTLCVVVERNGDS